MRIYFDAGYSKLNEPPLYVAYVIDGEHPSFSYNVKQMGVSSSCEAEYRALLHTLNDLYVGGDFREYGEIELINDNETLIRQQTGKYRVNHPVLQELYAEVQDFIELFGREGVEVKFTQVPRKYNKADEYVREAKK